METTLVTCKGQVTIPLKIRQQLGVRQGSKVAFIRFGDHIQLHIKEYPKSLKGSGFGMLKSKRRAIPVNFDLASMLRNQYE